MKNAKHLALLLALAIIFTCTGAYTANLAVAEAAAVDTTNPALVMTAANPIPDIAENVRPAVVQVISMAKAWDPKTGITEVAAGSGSGVYFDERGYIVTNNHVISDAESVEIVWLDGTRMKAEIVGTDSSTDLAVLKFEDKVDVTPVPLGDSDALRIGELSIVIGNPGSGSTVLFGTVTFGIISGLNREGIKATGSYTRPINVIQTTAQINSGNSGGALLNGNGELVGIPTLKSSFNYSSIVEGMGFAIPINTAKPIIADLIEYGVVIRPRFGVSVIDQEGPDEPLRNYLPAGVRIIEIEEDSPAEAANLQLHDVITHINGERCKSFDEMTLLVDQYEAGDFVTVTIARYYDKFGNVISPEVIDVEVELKILDN